jgi:uncharacterized membrane protein
MHPSMAVLAGAGLGASVMYLLDPDRGKRRRALIRDQVGHLTHGASEMAETTARDLGHHAQGVMAETRARFTRDRPTDEVLVARVRARLGRVSRHPDTLDVTARGGHVRVSGSIPATEAQQVRATIRSVRGVKQVEDHLDLDQETEEQPDLARGARGMEPLHEPPGAWWSPTKRLLAAAGGGALVAYGLSQRGVLGAATAITGTGLCVRGLTNLRFRRLLGLDRTRPAVALQKTLTVHAPVEDVFALWSHYEEFPRLLPHVREVRRSTAEQSHWVVTGPLGFPVWWDALVSRIVPNEVIAWNTLPGSQVSHRGSVRFEVSSPGSTRLDILLSYTPPAGVLGHLLATLLRANPKHLMDEDLVRFKSLLEDSRVSIHGREVTREDLTSQWRAGEAEPLTGRS